MRKYLWLIVVFPGLMFAYPVDLTIGGRSGGMAGAFTGISDDALSLYYNPGGLSIIRNNEMTAMKSHYSLISGLSLNWISVVSNVNEKMGVGFGWLNKSAVFEENGYDVVDTTKMGDNLFTLGLGFKVNKDIGVGIDINRLVLSSSIGGGSGFGMDIGVMAKYPGYPVYFGFVMKNLSAGMGTETYPTVYRIGIGYKTLPKVVIKTITKRKGGKLRRYRVREKEGYRLAIDLDIERKPGVVTPSDSTYREGLMHYYFGMEYSPMDIFGIRFGWNNIEGLTSGLRLGWQTYFVDFSYAFKGVEDKDLGIPITGSIWNAALTMEF